MMEEMVNPYWLIIDREGHAFVAINYLDKIPSCPSDFPIRDRFFNEPIQSAEFGPACFCLGPQLFVSINLLNTLLKSAFRPLRVRVVTNFSANGHSVTTPRLEDSNGDEVTFYDDIQSESTERTGLGQQEGGHQVNAATAATPIEGRLSLNDECDESAIVAARQDHEQYIDHFSNQEEDLSLDIDSFVEGSNNITTPTGPPKDNLNAADGALEATPILPRDRLIPPEDSFFSTSRALVSQLRALDLTDGPTLSALLHNRLPPCLSSLRAAQDRMIHLATLSGGRRTCLVRVFRDLHARRETDLSFPSLADVVGLARGCVTEHQRHELLDILREVASSPAYPWVCRGGDELRDGVDLLDHEGDDAAEPARPQFVSLASMRKKFLDRRYRTLEDLNSDLDLFATYHGESHEDELVTTETMIRRQMADEIRTMMRARCAIGRWDVLDPLFQGLLRELVVSSSSPHQDGSSATDPGQQSHNEDRQHVRQRQKQQQEVPTGLPRYVLPLGRLYRADTGAAPRPLDCLVLMDVTTPRKALWLLRRSSDVDDQETAADHPGKADSCRQSTDVDFVLLEEDISQWTLGSREDNRDGGLVRRKTGVFPLANEGATRGKNAQRQDTVEHTLLRVRLMTEYPESLVRLEQQHGAVSFKRVDRWRAKEEIQRGWGISGLPKPAFSSPFSLLTSSPALRSLPAAASSSLTRGTLARSSRPTRTRHEPREKKSSRRQEEPPLRRALRNSASATTQESSLIRKRRRES